MALLLILWWLGFKNGFTHINAFHIMLTSVASLPSPSCVAPGKHPESPVLLQGLPGEGRGGQGRGGESREGKEGEGKLKKEGRARRREGGQGRPKFLNQNF